MTPSYTLGLFFILCVSLIWAAASVLVQHLYRDMNFDSPFLLTYISTALFVLWIPTRLILERRGRCKRFVQRSWKRVRKAVGVGGSSYEVMASAERESEEGQCRDYEDAIIPWRNDVPITVASSDGAWDNIEMERVREPYQSLISPQEQQQQEKQSSGSKNNGAVTDGYKDEPDGNGTLSAPKDNDGQQVSPTATNGATAISGAHQATHPQRRHMRPQVLSHLDHISMAVKIAPVWFLSNFFYNTSLAYTSITSSTVLASTGSLFTFLFAVSCGDERFTAYKLFGVILCFTGSVLTGLGDVESENNNLTLAADATGGDDLGRILDNMKPTASLSTEATRIILSGVDRSGDASDSASGDGDMVGSLVLGDLAGLISAIGYGTYTVLIRSLCPRNEDQYSMQLLLGYIGLFNGVLLLPIAVKRAFFDRCSPLDQSVLGYHGDEYPSLSVDVASSCERITALVFAYLIAKAFFDNVLSDYLWARAVVLTSATVATVGLGLTIPLAFLSDWLLGRSGLTTPESVVGAFSVLVGFLLVNCGEGSSNRSSHIENDESSVSSGSGHEIS